MLQGKERPFGVGQKLAEPMCFLLLFNSGYKRSIRTSRSLGVPWVPCMKKEVVAEVKIYASL